VLTGPTDKPWDLYEMILRRSSEILRDPGLRDGQVDLAAAGPTGGPVVVGGAPVASPGDRPVAKEL
jgi:hypothetical protein